MSHVWRKVFLKLAKMAETVGITPVFATVCVSHMMLGHPWDSLGQLGIENGELGLEVLKMQNLWFIFRPYPESTVPMRSWIQDPKLRPKARTGRIVNDNGERIRWIMT